MKVKLKGINTVRFKLATGGVATYYYHRASGKRLEGRPGTPQFLASIAQAEKAISDRGSGTFADLIRRFEQSPYYGSLSDATRADYKWRFAIIEKEWGSCPIAAIADPSDDDFARDVLRWRDQRGLTAKRSADALVSAIARVLSFAKENREIKHNPLATFKRVYKNDRSEKTWSDGLIARFREVARAEMITAMMLVSNVGLRALDIRRLPWSAYDGQAIAWRTSKKGTAINVPVTVELKGYLDGLPRKGVLILTTPTGKAYAKRYFNLHWREDSDLAGAGDLNFHDLRGTAATRLAEAGASASIIASVMGWEPETAEKIIATYVARSSALAAKGIELLEKHRKKRKPKA